MDADSVLRVLQAVAVLWHVVAFGAGGVYVYYSYRALFGLESYTSRWGRIIRTADVHLWLSGFALIAVSAPLVGMEKYFSNPKLWTKITVITVWLLSTQHLRHVALPKFIAGKRGCMLMAASVNLGCWLYGAFLGCAKGLAYGNASFAALLTGFVLTILVYVWVTLRLEKRIN